MPLTFRTMFLCSISRLHQTKGWCLSFGGSFGAAAPPVWRGGVGGGCRRDCRTAAVSPDRPSRSGLAVRRCAPGELLLRRVLVGGRLERGRGGRGGGRGPGGGGRPRRAGPAGD